VFSWAQCRLMLPGWFGFGAAVSAWRARHGREGMALLAEMHREWGFFRTLLSNMDMVLGKSDIAIAERYSLLVRDEALREAIFPRLKAEWQASIDALLAITGENGAARPQPAAQALDPQPLSLPRPAQPHPESSCCAAIAPAKPTTACSAASTSRSTASPRACATAAEAARRAGQI
jgi:hypothetical protein